MMEEVTLSVIMGELANRSVSFIINKWSKQMAPTNQVVDRLQTLLLRIGAMVEEADGQRITNQAMLLQLSILRKELYKGYYTLDTFRHRAHEDNKTEGHEMGRSFAMSRFNPAKRLCICTGSRESVKDLTRVLKSLESSLQDAAEFIMLSRRYPHLARQPYSIYLLLDKCMFGRQMEMELVINILLQAQDPGSKHHEVLPIIGPRKVGKSTLVEYVSIDERVCSYFSQIMFLSGDDLKGELVVTLGSDRIIKYDNGDLIRGRVLIIVELDADISEGLWKRLLSTSRILAPGSKFIVIGRSEKIISFGTTLPLILQFFTPEIFWYFFKVRMFGSMDVIEHPKLASVAMDMAKELNRCFICFNIIYEIVKSNIDAHFWILTLAFCRHFKQKNPFVCDPPDQVDMYQTASTQNGAHCCLTTSAQSDSTSPKMTVKDQI
ncbi:hypothetical protein BAE44_0006500 [Dichanthelium oligosanthes]|uniref:Rx N-terminal domain-containing protein n=1 Tax=Dichanthelium oligosanthes TaxID=888268 RepID=A0A1E5W565_9POAL|nr:hypothetical protein BAE44_0006500 [Dichanthelium oligosanthes]